ncbi:MAG: polyprenol monophosphomannose synthase [Candidatus Omnitrophica bacterium]|nr:polyprenol monophosphomannose synthase [Candidatus Omnitrophota bacterium]MDD5771364.1 polyprenol monophosphomannose synthase [Candidatus Omnitrophota bacterium]
MNKTSQKFSLVIPTYNEAENIQELVNILTSTLSGKVDFEIIIVDDDSPDLTWEFARRISENDRRVKVIRRTAKKGLATAVIYGWKAAQGDILGVMDGDLQQPPGVIPLLLERLGEDRSVDIVIASRNIKGGAVSGRSIWRTLVSGVGAFICKLLLPGKLGKVSDPMSGFFVLRKEVIDKKDLSPWGYKILLEVLVKGEYRGIAEVPYAFSVRSKGYSKAGIKQYLISFFYLLKLSLQSRMGLKSLR